MKTSCFEAVVNFFPKDQQESLEALIIYKKSKISCSLYFYQQIQKGKLKDFFVRVCSHDPLFLKWKDKFEIWMPGEKALLGKGQVLNPESKKANRHKEEERIAYLQKLWGDERQMLLALVEEKGIRGVRERGALSFASLNRMRLFRYCLELEEMGEVRIISFSPLFLISKKSFDFLGEKVLAFLSRFHQKYPQEQGASLEKIKRRFGIPQKVFNLAINRLAKEMKIKRMNRTVALFDFKRSLSAEEERILHELEEMCFKGEFRSFSIEELRQRFHLSSLKLNQLLSFLIERKKIVQGKDGFIIHSRWLDEIIAKIHNSGQKELTVSDFKKMIGLSRKYAIPLLELLDELGVTRRRGPIRLII